MTKKKERRIKIYILHLIFRDFQGFDRDFIGLKKQNQYNKPSFHSLIRHQNTKNQY